MYKDAQIVTVIFVGRRLGDSSSNHERAFLYFTNTFRKSRRPTNLFPTMPK